jgi:hypothetical protein
LDEAAGIAARAHMNGFHGWEVSKHIPALIVASNVLMITASGSAAESCVTKTISRVSATEATREVAIGRVFTERLLSLCRRKLYRQIQE